MTPLEWRYRRLLRLLPADYRAAWAEDMVATFLLASQPDDPDDAEFEAEHGRPGLAEVASVVSLAVRLRLGGVGAPAAAFARGAVVRLVALVGLLVHAVGALGGVVSLVVSQSRFPTYVVSDLDTGWTLSGLVWVGAYLALVTDRRRLAVALTGAGVVPSVVSAATGLVEGESVAVVAYRLLMTVLPLLALAAFHRDAPPVPTRPWLVALPVGVVVVGVVVALTQSPDRAVLDWPGTLCGAVFVAAVAHLVVGRPGPWSGALVVLALAVLGERVVTVLDYSLGSRADTGVLVTAGVVQGAAVAVAVVLLAARRLLRRPA